MTHTRHHQPVSLPQQHHPHEQQHQQHQQPQQQGQQSRQRSSKGVASSTTSTSSISTTTTSIYSIGGSGSTNPISNSNSNYNSNSTGSVTSSGSSVSSGVSFESLHLHVPASSFSAASSSHPPSPSMTPSRVPLRLRTTRNRPPSFFSYRFLIFTILLVLLIVPLILPKNQLDSCAVQREFKIRHKGRTKAEVGPVAELVNQTEETKQLERKEEVNRELAGEIGGIPIEDAIKILSEPSEVPSSSLSSSLSPLGVPLATNTVSTPNLTPGVASTPKVHVHHSSSYETPLMLFLLITCCMLKARFPDSPASAFASHGAGGNSDIIHLSPTLLASSSTPSFNGSESNKVSNGNNSANGSNSHHRSGSYTSGIVHVRAYESLKVIFAYMFYLACYFLCNALKAYLGDFTCNNHSNSVSGHYLFHVYTALALLHHHAVQQEALRSSVCPISIFFMRKLFATRSGKLFMFFYVAYVFVSGLILQNTYYFGYHSIRQILYGSSLALACHLFLVEILELLDWNLFGLIAGRRYLSSYVAELTPVQRVMMDWFGVRGCMERTERVAGYLDNGSGSSSSSTSTSTTSGKAEHYRPRSSSLRSGVFYIWPITVISTCQAISFILLIVSPEPDLWRWADLAAVFVGWLIVLYIYQRYLRMPTQKCEKSKN